MIIDQLPLLGGDVQGTDEFPIERGTTTYKTTQAALIKAATDAAAAAQAAADNAQDTADEANEKGLPPGGTAGQVLTKADSSDYSASWEDPSGGDVTADMLGIVIDGNSTPVGASVGQYVIVKNSTITGITDGLYTATQAIPANTAIDSTYLTAVSDGGLNAVKRDAQWKLVWTNPNPTNSFPTQTVSVDLRGYSWAKTFFIRDNVGAVIVGSLELPVGESTGGAFYGVSYNLLARRGIQSISQSEITFGSGGVYNNYGGGTSSNDLVIIPYKIYAR